MVSRIQTIEYACCARYERIDDRYEWPSPASLSLAVDHDDEISDFETSNAFLAASFELRAYKKSASSERSVNSKKSDSGRMTEIQILERGTSFPDSRTYKATLSASHVSEIDTGTISVRIQEGESDDQTGWEYEAQSPERANFLSDTSGYLTVTRLVRSFETDKTISELALAMILGDGIGAESFSA